MYYPYAWPIFWIGELNCRRSLTRLTLMYKWLKIPWFQLIGNATLNQWVDTAMLWIMIRWDCLSPLGVYIYCRLGDIRIYNAQLRTVQIYQEYMISLFVQTSPVTRNIISHQLKCHFVCCFSQWISTAIWRKYILYSLFAYFVHDMSMDSNEYS